MNRFALVSVLGMLPCLGNAQVVSTVLAPDPPPSPRLRFVTGDAVRPGKVTFTLVAWDESRRFIAVTVPANEAAEAKALRIRNAANDVAGGWRATASGRTLTFDHYNPDNGQWEELAAIERIVDTTESPIRLEATNQAMTFTITMDNLAAMGTDDMGRPSLMSLTVSDTPRFDRLTPAGEPAETTLSALADFLEKHGGEGVSVVRTDPRRLDVGVRYVNTYLSLVSTDSAQMRGMQVGVAVDMTAAGLIDR